MVFSAEMAKSAAELVSESAVELVMGSVTAPASPAMLKLVVSEELKEYYLLLLLLHPVWVYRHPAGHVRHHLGPDLQLQVLGLGPEHHEEPGHYHYPDHCHLLVDLCWD